jgi:Tfp pilus assembly protein PilV
MISLSGSKKGFTLVEVLVSGMLLTLVWLAAVEAIIISKIMPSVARHKIQAIYTAQRAIEDLHRKPFSLIANNTAVVSIDTKGTPDNVSDDLLGSQTITVTSQSNHYKKVVVTVTWNERMHLITKAMTERCGTFITDDPQTN